MVITVEIYDRIRKMYQQEGYSKREIARQLKISRNTVTKYCDGSQVPWERKSYESRQRTVLTDDVIAFIKHCLWLDEIEGTTKQKHTAARIYNRLVEELDFKGGETTVRRAVRELKELHHKAFIPLAFDPGEAAQIDFGSAVVKYRGKRTIVKFFCVRLCHSAAYHATAFPAENETCFLEGHIRAFEFLKGIPKRIIFDNAKVAVKEGLGAYVTKEHPAYKALQAHYAFSTDYCNAGQGHEKGLVEGLVGFIRRNVFVPMPRVDSFEELNALIEKRCLEYLTHQIRGRNETVGAALQLEQQKLTQLPPYRMDVSDKCYVRVNTNSLVQYQTNRYSVPCRYVGLEVTLKASSTQVEILYKTEVIAAHDRLYGRYQKSYQLTHYVDVLEQRPRAVFNAEPVRAVIPKEILESFMLMDDGRKKVLEYIKQTCELPQTQATQVQKQSPDVIPVSLNPYDQLIREVNA